MRLEIRQLELLLAVERAGSISGAARSLGVEQPHATRQLRQIEELLGQRVFDRTGSGTRVTTSGAEILDRARTAMQAVDGIAPDAEAEHRTDTFRVLYRGLDPLPVVMTLRTHFPDAAVTAVATRPAEGRAELVAGNGDLFLATRIPHEPWPEPAPLVEIRIVADPTMVFLPAGHRLAGKEEIDLSELADDDWITGNDPEVVRMVREECRLLGGFEPRLAYRADGHAVIESLLERGLGVVFGGEASPRLPTHVARRYRGATPAHWTLTHRPGVLPGRLLAELTATLRAHHRDLVARAEEFERRHP